MFMETILNLEELRGQITSTEIGTMQENAALAGDPLKLICKFKPIIIAALKIAMFFVGKNEKEILQQVIDALKAMCEN
jgi:hypothetical protein